MTKHTWNNKQRYVEFRTFYKNLKYYIVSVEPNIYNCSVAVSNKATTLFQRRQRQVAPKVRPRYAQQQIN